MSNCKHLTRFWVGGDATGSVSGDGYCVVCERDWLQVQLNRYKFLYRGLLEGVDLNLLCESKKQASQAAKLADDIAMVVEDNQKLRAEIMRLRHEFARRTAMSDDLQQTEMATNIELQVDAWHDRKFGNEPVNVPAAYRKLLEEVGELGEAIMKHDSAACHEEIGDVLHVLRHIVRATVGGNASMMQLLADTVDKCERRRRAAAEGGD